MAVAGYLFHKTGSKAVFDALAQCDLRLVVLTLPLVIAVQMAGGLRIQWLLADQRCYVSYPIALKTTLIGVLTGMAFFGPIGGDAARLYLFKQRAPRCSLVQVGWALVADRFSGMFALCLVVLFINRTASLSWRTSSGGRAALVAAAVVGSGCVMAMVFSHWKSGLHWCLRRIGPRVIEKNLSSATDGLHQPRWQRALLLSFFIHLCALTAGCLMALACGLKIATWDVAAIISTTTLVLAFPLTPFGLGIRDGSLLLLFQLAGVTDRPQILAVSALLLMPPLFSSALGALSWTTLGIPETYAGSDMAQNSPERGKI